MKNYHDSLFSALSGLVPSGDSSLPKKGTAKYKHLKKLFKYYKIASPTHNHVAFK